MIWSEAIGLPKSRLCTFCWDGAEPGARQLWLVPPLVPDEPA